MITRADVVLVARTYINTPFHHRGRTPGVGLDCVGIPICVCRELGTIPPDFDVPPYTPTPDGRSMRAWCDEYLRPVSEGAMRPGDMLMAIVDKDPQHICVIGDHIHGGLSIIHASNSGDNPRVVETRLMFSRVLRFVAAYKLPGIQ